jgi:hypothetical protein
VNLLIEITLTSFSSADISDPGGAIKRTIMDSELVELLNESDVVKIPSGRVPFTDESPTANSISPLVAASETSKTMSMRTLSGNGPVSETYVSLPQDHPAESPEAQRLVAPRYSFFLGTNELESLSE